MSARTHRRPRMKPWRLLLDPFTARELEVRAAAHGVTRPAYARAAITGRRPGGMPGQPAAAADTWWDHLSPSRRAQVHGWLTAGRGLDQDPDTDQLAMFNTEEA